MLPVKNIVHFAQCVQDEGVKDLAYVRKTGEKLSRIAEVKL